MDANKAADIISRALGKNVEVKEVTLVGSGYHSDGYKAITSHGSFFIKKVKSKDLGFEFPQRVMAALTLSDAMNKRNGVHPLSIGIVKDEGLLEKYPDIGEDADFYNVQEFGGEGESYLSILKSRTGRKYQDSDREEVLKFVNFLVHLHGIRHPSQEKKIRNAVYNDYLRSIIGNPEYTLQLLHAFPQDSEVLSPGEQKEYLGLMLRQMHKWKDRSDRLCALHGDFWPANAIYSQGSYYFIDYSRMPWGDPAMDVGLWLSTYLFLWHDTGNDYYRMMGQTFLDEYINATKDREILNAVVYPLSLVAIMYAHPTWVPGIRQEIRKEYYDHVIEMLDRDAFFWE